MTKELLQTFQDELGTGTGAARYRQFRELAKASDFPLKELGNGRFSTSNETISEYQALSHEEKNELFKKYRDQTKGQAVRLSSSGLTEIEEIVSNFKSFN